MRTLSSEELEEQFTRLDEHGFTVVEGAIPSALIDELSDALAQVQAEHDIGYRETAFEGTRTMRIYNLLAYHRAFEKIPVAPLVLSIAARVLDPELQLSSFSAICPGPGQQPQPLHGDSQLIPLPRPHVPIALNAMWALTDFTEDNGATGIVPGSHRFEQNPEYGSSEGNPPICNRMDKWN